MNSMLKKCIALFMVVFIMSASFSVYAEESTDTVTIPSYTELQILEYNKDLEFLKAVGVWTSPYTDHINKVTRAEFASALAGLCNLDKAAAIQLTYTDVGADTPFAEDIYAVGVANLMVGSDNMFRPDDYITYNQAAKAVVSALGYDGIANSKGGYPDGFYSVAMSLGLSVGAGRDSYLTRYDVVTLFAKAAETDIMNVIGVENKDVVFSVTEGKTALDVYHNIAKTEDILTDNGLTNLKGKSQASGNNVIIGNIRLKNDTVNTDGLLGYNVIAYYKTDEEKLLYIEENEKKNDVLTINAEDLMTDSAKFTKTNVVYKNGNKSVGVKVSPYADFIYNYSAYSDFLADDMKIKTGTLTFVDTDFDKNYDVVIAEEFENFVIQANNVQSQVISDRHGNTINYGEYKKYEFFTITGETKAISLLKANSILSVFRSKDDTRIKVIVSEEKIPCKVTGLETDEDGKELVTVTRIVDGEEVETTFEYSESFLENVANNVRDFKKLSLNAEVSLRLDFQGRIAAIEDYNENYQYAYFLAAGKDTNSKLVEKCLVKLCLDTGDIATLVTAKKVIINGVATDNGSDILGVADLYADGDTSGEFQRQIVKIKLTSLGEIKELDTTNSAEKCTSPMGFDLTKFCLVYETPKNSYSDYLNSKRNSFSGEYNMDANTTIFLVPNDDEFDENYIKVIPHEKLYDLAQRSTVKLYDANEFWTVKAVEAKAIEGAGFLPKAMSVIKSVKGVNADGEDIYMVTGRYKDEEYTFREERPGLIDKKVPGGLKFGDIVAIKVDENYNIVDVKLRVRTSESGPFNDVVSGEGVYYGHIYAKNDTTITLSTDYGASVKAHMIATGPQPIIIDYVNHEVRQGKYSDVPASASIDENGNFTFSDNGVTMYVYKYSGYINDAVVVFK